MMCVPAAACYIQSVHSAGCTNLPWGVLEGQGLGHVGVIFKSLQSVGKPRTERLPRGAGHAG